MSNTLYVQVFSQLAWDASTMGELNVLNYVTSKEYAVQSTLFIFEYGGSNNSSATPYPIFVDDDTAIAFSSASAGATLITLVNTNYGVTYYTDYDIEKVAAPLIPALANKVDKIVGKGLSTNDYTTAEQTKLAGLSAQVQPDWSASSGLASILNKPSIPTVPTNVSSFTNDAGYVTSASILSATLTGLGAGSNAAIVSTDTILAALAKLQNQVTNNFTRTTSVISPSLVGTGATGTQVSSTKNSTVRLWLNESVTSSIGGAATAVINVKICATNNATEASWTTLGAFEEDQTVTLAIALQSVQVMKGMIEFDLPAGWYWKAESSGSGTNSESIISGQQTIYG